MKRQSHKPYFLLLGVLLMLMSFSQSTTEKLRGSTIATLAPCWECLASIPLTSSPAISTDAMQKLQLENQLLRQENRRLQQMLQHERISPPFQLNARPARVIFRSPASWNSSLWINAGKKSPDWEHTLAKNSPVVVGNSVIGVIDYVGNYQSRVRLITDSGLNPSVRVLRNDGTLLAKGELHGSSKPLWRARGQLLHGIGFNYDFPDSAGPARELRTGIPLNSPEEQKGIPLLKVKDLLVTTGMDGVFPAGLHVAKVSHVYNLKEGDYYYEIDAEPTAGNLHDLSIVYVMPPIGYDPNDLPPNLVEDN